MLKILSLFSGIGAFEKALERQGIEYQLVNYCEIDKYASKAYSLIHNVSEQMNLGDITKINIDELNDDIDLLTYAFPCQDISVAGRQNGFEKDGKTTRSGLFFEALRIIEGTKPKVAICENVKNLTSNKFSKEFSIVLRSLEEAGYNNYWKVLNAKQFGIPQNRERVFIVSIRKDIDSGDFKFPEPFELKLRLKDMLENTVEEKYFLSDQFLKGLKQHNQNHHKKGTGFIWKPKTGDETANCLRENAALCPTDNTVIVASRGRYDENGNVEQYIEPKLIQVGQIYGTEREPNPQAGRVYDANGLSPTMDTCSGGNRMPKVIVQEIDAVNPMPDGTCRTIKHQYANTSIANTVRTGSMGVTMVSEKLPGDIEQNEKNKVYNIKDKHVNLSGRDGNERNYPVNLKDGSYRIRKLTPRECFRLMGFDDSDFDKVEGNLSNSQLYKMAGNSIVVNVLEEIYKQLFKAIKL